MILLAALFLVTQSSFLLPVSQANSRAEALISELQKVSEEGPGFQAMGLSKMFLPVDASPEFEGGILGAPPLGKQEALRELVAMGVDAVPALLSHIDDVRPTRVAIKHEMGMGGMVSAAEYWPRYDDKPRQPSHVKLVNYYGYSEDFRECPNPYRLKVGDLCYVALGQIVNRPLVAVRYQPTMFYVIDSPVLSKDLAAAARADWTGLSSREHEASLTSDAEHPKQFLTTEDALKRLRFYYPDRYILYVLEVLSREPYDRAAIREAVIRIGEAPSEASIKDVFDFFKLGHDPAELDMLGRAIHEELGALAYAPNFPSDDYLKTYAANLEKARDKFASTPPREDPYRSLADLDLIQNVLVSLKGTHSKALEKAVKNNLSVLEESRERRHFSKDTLSHVENLEREWLQH